MKKNTNKKQDKYELKEENDLSKMTILPKGCFDPQAQKWERNHCIGT
jgi:hypothetical protein